MTDMTVLHLTGTAHVLAAVTCTAAVTPALMVKDLAFGGLQIRGVDGAAGAIIGVDRLTAATINADPAVLANPRGYAVAEAANGSKSVEPIASASTITIKLAANTLTVDTPTTTALSVLAIVRMLDASAPAPLELTGTIDAGTPATFDVALTKGRWSALAFVTGRLPGGRTDDIP